MWPRVPSLWHVRQRLPARSAILGFRSRQPCLVNQRRLLLRRLLDIWTFWLVDIYMQLFARAKLLLQRDGKFGSINYMEGCCCLLGGFICKEGAYSGYSLQRDYPGPSSYIIFKRIHVLATI